MPQLQLPLSVLTWHRFPKRSTLRVWLGSPLTPNEVGEVESGSWDTAPEVHSWACSEREQIIEKGQLPPRKLQFFKMNLECLC